MTESHPSPPHVLIVEDDADIREFMAQLLADEGYAVTQAVDGRAGLDALDVLNAPAASGTLASASHRRPDLIILDLMMPNLDGFGFRAGQRHRPNVRDVPVILITARRSLGPDVDGLGVAAVLPKPFEVSTLLTLVDQLTHPSPT